MWFSIILWVLQLVFFVAFLIAWRLDVRALRRAREAWENSQRQFDREIAGREEL
ncbi:MAG: hypothetical protein NVS3B1_12690 [Marmoricola sp.]